MTWKLLAVAFGFVTTGLAVLVVWQLISRARLRQRFAGILDLEQEITTRRAAFERQLAARSHELELAREQATQGLADTLRTTRELRARHATSKASYDRLRAELGVLERASDDFAVGLYTPSFAFASSDDYKRRLTEARDQQRATIRADHAVKCNPAWAFGDSRKSGARIQKQYAKALLRAFNSECDAAIARIAWNNVTRTIERVKLAFDAINKLGSELQVEITARYRELKLDELRLEYELAQKRHHEQEEQREIRAQLRDEDRAQEELDSARRDAEVEEAAAQHALDRARDELAGTTGVTLDDQLGKLAAFQDALREAQQRKARAIAQVQQARAGYVYVLSNIGSFGETVYKIGMTRRVNPMEHVRELSTAALPFDFDVHALIRTDDAPALEAKLHQELFDRRLNLMNPKRAFFHATLDEIATFVKSQGHEIQLTRVAEAQQYRESLALRRKLVEPVAAPPPPSHDAAGFAFPQLVDEIETMPVRPARAPSSSSSSLVSSWANQRARGTGAPFPEETPVG